jgi:energy-coupling factor transport system ATP-binding protein
MIKVDQLFYSYDGQKEVLKDISFSIDKGKYVVLMGHNGSGKSTLAKLLAGLLEVTRGEIAIKGITLNTKSIREIRHQLGIVFQNPDNQFIGATVADDLAFGLENRKVPHEQMQGIIDQFSEQVGMKAFLHQEPASLSGGQKQRVAIAGVLAMQPSILLLDEATAMLDPQGKQEIRELILSIKKTMPELTILAITHDVEEAVLADELLVLNQGKLAYQGKPDALFLDSEKTKSLRLDTPFVYQLQQAFPNQSPKDIHDLHAWVKQLWPSK